MYSVFISMKRNEAMIYSYTGHNDEKVIEKIKENLKINDFIKEINFVTEIKVGKKWGKAVATDESGNILPLRYLEKLIMSGGVI